MIRPICLALALWPAIVSAETDGRALYHGHVPFAAQQRLPPEHAACAACHGPLGEGGTEGGVTAPPLRWPALTQPRANQPELADAAAIARAITAGAGRTGALHPAMPRFRLSATEQDALLAYLHVVGTPSDLPPGVEVDVVAVGTILPLSGPAAAIGQAVLAGLRDVLDDARPVYGRRVMLFAEDAAPNRAPAAVAALIARPVFAVVAGLWRADERTVDEALALHRVAHVGSLVVRHDPAETGAWSADLLPPLSEQDSALAATFDGCDPTAPRVALDPGGRSSRNGGGILWQRTPPPTTATPGCLGAGLAMLEQARALARFGWRVGLVLPIPAGLGADPWRQLGRASARVLLELLARSGAMLHERSLLAQLPALSGFEPLPGLPVRYSRQRLFAWDPATIALPADP